MSAVICLALNWHRTSIMALLMAAEISGFCIADSALAVLTSCALAVLTPCALGCWFAVSELDSVDMGTDGCVISALKNEDIRKNYELYLEPP